MKVVIDVDKLLHEGRITDEEYVRLKSLAAEETGSLGFNILIGFGVIATAGGILALVPSAPTALFLGLALSAAGVFLSSNYKKEWGLLGTLCLLVGSISTAGSILFLMKGALAAFLIVAILLLAASVTVKSGLLAAMAVLSLTAASGGATGYWHAEYALAIYHPALTVCLFGILSLASYLLSKRLPLDYQRLAIIIARTSLFVVNLGFWIGSLWGDDPWDFGTWPRYGVGRAVPALAFVIGWAVGLLATGVWGVRANKRWVVNVVAVFGAIHFYTQYFELLGPRPEVILFAGLIALGIAFGIVRYNKGVKGAAMSAASFAEQPRPLTESQSRLPSQLP